MDLMKFQHAVYVHHCLGGAEDGKQHPASHCYDTLTISGIKYQLRGEPVPMEAPATLQVLNCTDDYMEPVFFRVEMVHGKTT